MIEILAYVVGIPAGLSALFLGGLIGVRSTTRNAVASGILRPSTGLGSTEREEAGAQLVYALYHAPDWWKTAPDAVMDAYGRATDAYGIKKHGR